MVMTMAIVADSLLLSETSLQTCLVAAVTAVTVQLWTLVSDTDSSSCVVVLCLIQIVVVV